MYECMYKFVSSNGCFNGWMNVSLYLFFKIFICASVVPLFYSCFFFRLYFKNSLSLFLFANNSILAPSYIYLPPFHITVNVYTFILLLELEKRRNILIFLVSYLAAQCVHSIVISHKNCKSCHTILYLWWNWLKNYEIFIKKKNNLCAVYNYEHNNTYQEIIFAIFTYSISKNIES